MGAERSQWQFPANEVGKVIGWSDEASPSNPSASKGLVNKGPFLADAKFVATRTALKALDTTVHTSAFLAEAGREGGFVWRSGDYSTLITTDTQEGIFVKADAIASTAGAWVRVGGWLVAGADIRWFGAVVGAVSTAALQCVINLGYRALIPDGDFHVDDVLVKEGGTVRLLGNGHIKSKLTWTSVGNGMEFGLTTPIDLFQCAGVALLTQNASLSNIAVTAEFSDNAEECDIDFRDNRIAGVVYANDGWGGGVLFTNPTLPQIRNNFIIGRLGLTDAQIESSLSGIELVSDRLAIVPQIHDNYIIRFSRGIYVHITSSPGAEGVYVVGNSCVDCTWCIEIKSDFVGSYAGAQYNVLHNHCEFHKKGIFLDSLNDFFVTSNMQIGSGTAGAATLGVHVKNCRRGVVSGTTVHDGTAALNTTLSGVVLEDSDAINVLATSANTPGEAVAFIDCTNCNEHGAIQRHANNLRFADVNGANNNKRPEKNVVSATYTANTTLTTVIPEDDTIPQNTEGTEILTATITPRSAASRVRVTFRAWGTTSAAAYIAAALFRDSVANALQVSAVIVSTANHFHQLVLEYVDSPASVAAVTYKIRVGPTGAVNMRLNGSMSARFFGGASAATLIVEEINS